MINLWLRSIALIVGLGVLLITAYAAPTPNALKAREAPPPWQGIAYEKNLTPKEKIVFTKDLTGHVHLGKKLTDAGGGNNFGMYLLAKEYKNHPADTLILKALATDSDVTFGEVKALEHIHEYVDSGIMLIPEISKDIKVRVIVMLRKVGHEVLVKSEGYKNANADDKKKMKEDGLEMMCKKVASFVVNEEIFHSDNFEENALFEVKGTTLLSVELVDWGCPGVYTVKNNVKGMNEAKREKLETEVYDWCVEYWKDWWS